MGFLEDNILLIVCIILALIVVIEGVIIYNQQAKQSNKEERNNNGSSDPVSEDNSLEVLYKEKCDAYDKLLRNYLLVDEEYKKACVEIYDLREAKDELKENQASHKRRSKKLKHGKESAPFHESEFENPTEKDITITSQIPTQEVASSEVVQEPDEEPKEELKSDSTTEPKVESPKEVTMYASFPRSAESRNYFSDLSENRVDDSYFEFKMDTASGKATFRPLDFMKIRNYDPAMAAMQTEGVKPNVASTVLRIEPGKAHIEGKDWIIDNLAKIILA